jgi:mono/diheme cytochrome c family protein
MAVILRSLFVAAALLLLLGPSCSQTGSMNGVACGSQKPGPQGWTDCEQFSWYTDTQGSRLVPQAWLHALEQPDNTQTFLDPAYIAGFRYLPSPVPAAAVKPQDACPLDPSLPLGFVVDCQSDRDFKVTALRWKAGQSDTERWVGMNCSACHTAQLAYQAPGQPTVTVRVDGGPTLADFQSFTEALDLALIRTAGDPAKFDRFAASVLGQGATASDQAMLRAALNTRIKWNAALARLNGDPHLNGGPIPYGFGRLDAVGHIFNKVALTALPDDAIDQTVNPADAPVSYPFLWNVPQQDRVEWDGLAQNDPAGSVPGVTFDFGALGRNTGEVIGVFGDLIIKPHAGKLEGYVSSINEQNLEGMELRIATLRPPVWPAQFPPIDTALAGEGGQVFKDRHCDACHTVPSVPVNLTERYTVTLSRVFASGPQDRNVVGTDMWMACNVALDQSKAGAFAGSPLSFLSGTPIGDPSFTAALTKNAVTGTLIGKKKDLVATELAGVFGIDRGLPLPVFAQVPGLTAKEIRRRACQSYVDDPKSPLMVYKGRPLQGIWATAPYLHDGSVPTLYDLLLPPDQRPASFYVGTRLYDPVRAGFRTDQAAEGNSVLFQARDAVTHAPIDGNSNAGHDYGNASLTPRQREALVEYMKSL